MPSYYCTRCDLAFDASVARCPRCLRSSTVRAQGAGQHRSPAPSPPGRSPAEKHLLANAVLQVALLPLHLLTLASVAINLIMIFGESASALGVSYEVPVDPAERASFISTFFVLGVWSLLGLVWTPLNAYGLWKRRAWARISTLLYWGGSLLTCCCIPFGIYGLVTLLRADVTALLRGPGGR